MMNCSLCHSDKIEQFLLAPDVHGRHLQSDEKFSVFRCSNCGVLFTGVRFSEDYYEKYYPDDYHKVESYHFLVSRLLKILKKASFNRRLRLMRRFGAIRGDVLEMGCGKGEFLDFLPASCHKYALEVSPACQRYIQNHCPGVTLLNRMEEALKSSQRYDVILLWQVLEHLFEPVQALKNLSFLLKPGGVIIFELPNAESLGLRWTKISWFHLDTPRHLFFFSKKNIEDMLKKNGLKIVYFGANEIEYFQDLAVSLYQKYQTPWRFVNWLLGFCVIPLGLMLRFLLSVMNTQKAEINTYVVTRI